MKFNDLKTAKKATRRRRGRGIAAGLGKTSGRGTKGQRSRSGGLPRPFFEGGQVPLIRKLPKLRGFKSHRQPFSVIYTGQLDGIKTNAKVIDNHVLARAELVDNAFCRVKLIVKGPLKTAHSLEIQAVSSGARQAVETAGGSINLVPRPKRPSNNSSTDSNKKVVK